MDSSSWFRTSSSHHHLTHRSRPVPLPTPDPTARTRIPRKSKETSHVIEAIGVPRGYKEGVIRISFGAFTQAGDIAALKTAFERVYRLIK